MQDTVATTMTSRRVSRALVAEWRSRSTSSLMEESFSMKVSVCGDVRLRLVVVVVGDEVLHRVVGQQFPEFVGELGGEGLVLHHHQGGPLDLLDQPGGGGALAGTGGAEQDNVLFAVPDALGQFGDGRRLVTGGLELADDFKRCYDTVDLLGKAHASNLQPGTDSQARIRYRRTGPSTPVRCVPGSVRNRTTAAPTRAPAAHRSIGACHVREPGFLGRGVGSGAGGQRHAVRQGGA